MLWITEERGRLTSQQSLAFNVATIIHLAMVLVCNRVACSVKIYVDSTFAVQLRSVAIGRDEVGRDSSAQAAIHHVLGATRDR